MKRVIFILFLVMVSGYTEIGEHEWRPLSKDCMELSQDCVRCLKLGCYFFELHFFPQPSACFPYHSTPPIPSQMIVRAIKNHVNCTLTPAPEVKESSPTGATAQENAPDNAKYIYAIAVLISIMVLAAVAFIVIFLRRRRGNGNLATQNLALNNIRRANPNVAAPNQGQNPPQDFFG